MPYASTWIACIGWIRRRAIGEAIKPFLTRTNAIGYLSTVTIAPITSTIRDVPSEVILDFEDAMKDRCAINLHNAITLSQDRLGKRVTSLSNERMRQVCAALRFALGCD